MRPPSGERAPAPTWEAELKPSSLQYWFATAVVLQVHRSEPSLCPQQTSRYSPRHCGQSTRMESVPSGSR